MKKILSVISLVILMFALPLISNAQTTVPSVTYQWTTPAGGSPVVQYVVEVRVDGGDWVEYLTTSNETVTFVNTLEYLKTYEVRVAGVDALDRQGPFSVPSDPYTPDLGVPGQPGQPIRVP